MISLGVVTCVLLVLGAYFLSYRRQRGRSYVPGPKPSWIPLVGNLKDLAGLEEKEFYYEWVGSKLKDEHGRNRPQQGLELSKLTNVLGRRLSPTFASRHQTSLP